MSMALSQTGASPSYSGPVEAKPFATLRVTTTASVILTEARNPRTDGVTLRPEGSP
jgi:hypothetical protein